MIFFKKDPVLGVDLESAINNAVFPGLQVSLSPLLLVLICISHSNLLLTSKLKVYSHYGVY